jgi:hypothetical protein
MSPTSFDWVESSKQGGHAAETRLVFANSTYFFRMVETGAHDEYMEFSPGPKLLEQKVTATRHWQNIFSILISWLQSLKAELEEPDKWEQVYRLGSEMPFQITEGNNSPFIYREVEQISDAIKRVRAELLTIGLQERQLRIANAKLDYLMEKAKTFGRIDWRNIMIGALVTLAMEAALPPEANKLVWTIMHEAFKTVLSLGM